jgi:hypothetical protein
LSCCGEKAYNEKTQVCCGGKITSVTHPYLTMCCGQTPFNYLNEQCCDSKAISTKDHLCCKGKTIAKMGKKNLACCGTGTYNTSEGVCCDETFYPGNPNRLSCCRAKTFDSHTQVRTVVKRRVRLHGQALFRTTKPCIRRLSRAKYTCS